MTEQPPDNKLSCAPAGPGTPPRGAAVPRDETRIGAVRARVQAGEYEVSPQLVAERMIALACASAASRRARAASTARSRPPDTA